MQPAHLSQDRRQAHIQCDPRCIQAQQARYLSLPRPTLEAWSEALRDEVAPLGIQVTIVEPGNFRTEFAGDVNMRPAQPLDPYRGVISPSEQFLYGQAGRQPGDPAKAAALMIAVVDSDTPPLRLMLGADAYELWDRVAAARQAELDTWRELGMATAFADARVIPIGASA